MAAASETIASYIHPEEKQARLQRVERRQFWLWVNELGVLLLAVTAFVLLSFPGFTEPIDPLYRVEPAYGFPGLVSLLLLFTTVSVHTKWQLRREQAGLLRPCEGTAAAEPEEEVSAAALDAVTGLPNRRAAEEWLGKEMASARTRRRALTLLAARWEGFGKVYRSGGNELCAKALQEAAERMKSAVRGSDLAAHLGDGLFVLALPGCSLTEAQRVQARIGAVDVRHGMQMLTLEPSSACVECEAGEGPAEFLRRGEKLLQLYADAEQSSDVRISA